MEKEFNIGDKVITNRFNNAIGTISEFDSNDGTYRVHYDEKGLTAYDWDWIR